MPLFPHADQLDTGVDYINQQVTQLQRQFPDASYSYELAIEYLSENRFNANNYKSIRSELNLLFNWAWFTHGCAIAELDRVSLRKFIDFCNQPPEHLITTAAFPYFITDKETKAVSANPKWRPFVKRGSGGYIRKQATLKAQLSLLSGFFLFLEDMDYCSKNPAAVLLRRLNVNNTRIAATSEQDKALSPAQWQAVWQHVNVLANTQPHKHERSRMLLAILYSLYPRVSEIAARPGFTPLMSQFYRHRSGQWLYRVPQSKGGKSRAIPCPKDLMHCLIRYRQFLGLSPLPKPGEDLPLFVRHQAASHGREAGVLHAQLGIHAIQSIVKDIFSQTATEIEQAHPYDAQELRQFTAHSLRHTGISNMLAQGASMQAVMKNAGHSDLSTLSIYANADLTEQVAAATKQALS
ncbi:tyrosine-type recombinase/integrase [Motilimonas pumila]|uniref:Site-specific integrase n=1 Tax=Motilimonas pumila TaxID=2303987 RepID=A0A418YD75_9GAMM|nr:site-specific integrase [Motilimonas pumila]RJG42475.1 site-specific integrase [Motilimonas pumila]